MPGSGPPEAEVSCATVNLSPAQRDFLAQQHSAAMITVGGGVPKVSRVGVALVEGRLWSSGTRDRVRTRRLRRDPRCTLFVFEAGPRWLGLETTVTLIEGERAATENLRLFRVMQGRPGGPLNWFGREVEEPEFLAAMEAEGRLVYEFQVGRAYGPV